MNMVKDDFGFKAFCMLAHPFHQIRALDSLGIPWPVIHFGGGSQLTAHLQARYEQGAKIGARGIDGSRIASRARTQNDQARVAGICHGMHSPCRVSECGVIIKQITRELACGCLSDAEARDPGAPDRPSIQPHQPHGCVQS